MATISSQLQSPNRVEEFNHVSLGSDIEPINSFRDFFREFLVESKKLAVFAAPLVVVMVCQHSMGTITQVFAGHIGPIQLAAIAIQYALCTGFSYGILLGMGSALETLCGQAYGAGEIDMLGIYLQRSWIILIITGCFLTILFSFASPILKLIGQDHEVAEEAGRFSFYMIPQIFALALNFPAAKFLQAQGKMNAMLVITAVGFVLHVVFSWLFMLKLGWGIVGAAVVLNFSWWFITVLQILYIFSGACGRTWSGFSMKAFKNLWGFTKLSLASAVMICLEAWYFVLLVIFAGYLKHAEFSISALSICINILSWELFISVGFSAAISVRVSNELGAGHPRTTRFSVVVAVIVIIIIGLFCALIIVLLRDRYPFMFTNSPEVRKLVIQLTPLLAVTLVINSVQPVLSGVAVGAGWQAIVAYVNIGCYYVLGIPLGLILAFKLKIGIKGIWFGMVLGTAAQTCILTIITCTTNWNKEASTAQMRVSQWKGSPNISKDVEIVDTIAHAQNDPNNSYQSPTSNSKSTYTGGHSNLHTSNL